MTKTTKISGLDHVVAWDESERRHVYLDGGDLVFKGNEVIHVGPGYVGTVDTVLRAMETQQKRQPVDWVFCYSYNSLVPHPVLMKSIETFWTKILPRFR